MSGSKGVGSSSIVVLQMLLILWTVTIVSANKRYCGAELVKVLSFLCDEFPDLHSTNKKSLDAFKGDGMGSDEWMNADESTQQQMILDQQLQTVGGSTEQDQRSVPMWMNMMYPSNYMYRHGTAHNELIPARFRKGRGGIVEECCLRPCGMSQLLQYCKTPSA